MAIKINFKPLDDVREKMGAKKTAIEIGEYKLNPEDLKKIKSSEGLERTVEDIEGDGNGLMYIANIPVVIFIQDTYSSVDKLRNDPHGPGVYRFHIIYDCPTLQDKIRRGTYLRYHFTASTEGKFDVFGRNGKHEFIRRVKKWMPWSKAVPVKGAELAVCQNCLQAIDYNDFRKKFDQKDARKWRGDFSIKHFFDTYAQGFTHEERPKCCV